MFQSLLNAWRLPDLRKKLLFTALIIAIYRLGCYIPVPGVDVAAINEMFNTGGVFDFYNLFAGGGSAAGGHLRHGDHALHHGVDHHAASDDGESPSGSPA